MDNNEKQNEMNLFDLICWCVRGIGRFFKWCGVSLLHLFRFSIQHIWIVLAFVVVFGVIGVIMLQPKHTKFRGGTTILFVEEAAPLISTYLQRIDLYCGSKEMVGLLNMPDSLQHKISKVRYYNWIDFKGDKTPDVVDFSKSKKYLSDTTNLVMKDRYFVQIDAKGLYDMADVQAWLQTYFDNQPELTAVTEQGRNALQSRLETYNREIARLDSLSNYEYFQRNTQNVEMKNGVMVSKGKQLYYTDILELIEERNQVQNALNQCQHNINFQNAIVVTSAVSSYVRLFLWLLAGYVLGVLLALCIDRRKEIAEYLRKK